MGFSQVSLQLRLLIGNRFSLPETYFRPPARPLRHAKRIEVPRVEYEKLSSDRAGEPSERIRARVAAARERQQARFTGTPLACNADTPAPHLRCAAGPPPALGRRAGGRASPGVQVWARRTSASIAKSTRRASRSCARSFHRVLKLGRTIAVLEEVERIHGQLDMSEAASLPKRRHQPPSRQARALSAAITGGLMGAVGGALIGASLSPTNGAVIGGLLGATMLAISEGVSDALRQPGKTKPLAYRIFGGAFFGAVFGALPAQVLAPIAPLTLGLIVGMLSGLFSFSLKRLALGVVVGLLGGLAASALPGGAHPALLGRRSYSSIR